MEKEIKEKKDNVDETEETLKESEIEEHMEPEEPEVLIEMEEYNDIQNYDEELEGEEAAKRLEKEEVQHEKGDVEDTVLRDTFHGKLFVGLVGGLMVLLLLFHFTNIFNMGEDEEYIDYKQYMGLDVDFLNEIREVEDYSRWQLEFKEDGWANYTGPSEDAQLIELGINMAIEVIELIYNGEQPYRASINSNITMRLIDELIYRDNQELEIDNWFAELIAVAGVEEAGDAVAIEEPVIDTLFDQVVGWFESTIPDEILDYVNNLRDTTGIRVIPGVGRVIDINNLDRIGNYRILNVDGMVFDISKDMFPLTWNEMIAKNYRFRIAGYSQIGNITHLDMHGNERQMQRMIVGFISDNTGDTQTVEVIFDGYEVYNVRIDF